MFGKIKELLGRVNWEDVTERAVKTFVQSALAAVPSLTAALAITGVTVPATLSLIVGVVIAGGAALISFLGNIIRNIVAGKVVE